MSKRDRAQSYVVWLCLPMIHDNLLCRIYGYVNSEGMCMMNAVSSCQSLTHERNQAISSLRGMILRGWLAQTALSEPPKSLFVPPFHPQVPSNRNRLARIIFYATNTPVESERFSRVVCAARAYSILRSCASFSTSVNFSRT